MPRERHLQKQIIEHLEGLGAKVWNMRGSGGQRKTVDLLVCFRGWFLALEVKRPGQVATPLQERELREVERAGGVANVVHSVEEVDRVLRGPRP